ncbi:membrane protein insertase YidC [Candidatus Uhrbacteria bacterium]|nr:membrane protein insertase YidC [Candidatus Uhrbacteria bacterium]MBD3283870.1 membrane protein insertase YidC [Candidatus Uhrbacteria bacterium]
MGQFFNEILTRPILNLLMWLYDVVPGHDIGIAIILLTVIIKVLLYPLAKKQIKQQKALQDLQPKIEEIRKQYKEDKEQQAKELMALYKAEKVNPAASCLPLLIQLPIFIALFHVLRTILEDMDLGSMLYSFIPYPGTIDPSFLGIVDLQNPNYVLAIAAGIVQYFQAKQIMSRGATKQPPEEVKDKPGAKDESMAAMMNKQMVYMMPIITVIIGFSLPGALILYWFTMSVLTVIQQWYMLSYKKRLEDQQKPPQEPPALEAGKAS